MKILHLADLHIGKKVNDFCMLKEQKHVLEQAIQLIKDEKIKAVLICGDVFDKSIPSIAALELFQWFLENLCELKIKVFIISGNHDNMDRLAYLSDLLHKSNIYISKSFDGKIEKIKLDKNINIYMMPYLYPALVRKYYPDYQIKNYNDAIKLVVDDIEINEDEINVILAHQFVIGKNRPELSQSEQKSVGGIDEIDYKIFDKFDYAALGHLHCPQKCGGEKIQYAGSILKYSFSEINQVKKFIVLDASSKNIKFENFSISFLHEMKLYKGYIDEFLNENFYKNINVNDYIYFILQDEYVIDAKKKLSLIYPNIMSLEFDNTFTRNHDVLYSADMACEKSIFEHFGDFYKLQTNSQLNQDKKKILLDIINEVSSCDR